MAGNGLMQLQTAPFTLLGAVTRLSYAVTPGFPRCRPSQTSPRRADAISDTMTAYVSGTRRALPVRAAGGPLPAFTHRQVTPAFPPMRRFRVAQSC